MAELKTKQTSASVSAFLNGIEDPQRRKDSQVVAKIMQRVTGLTPRMWGDSIVGFGSKQLKYASGRELDWFLAGFSPRKGSLTLYLPGGFEKYKALMRKLGKYKTGKSCLYVSKLEDIDIDVLTELIEREVRAGGAERSSS